MCLCVFNKLRVVNNFTSIARFQQNKISRVVLFYAQEAIITGNNEKMVLDPHFGNFEK